MSFLVSRCFASLHQVAFESRTALAFRTVLAEISQVVALYISMWQCSSRMMSPFSGMRVLDMFELGS